MYKITMFILTLYALVNILTGQNDSIRDRLRDKKYKVTKYSTKELTQLRNKLNRGYHILAFTDNSLSMTGICNSCSFSIEKFNGDSIKFGPGGCTLMNCEGAMSLEDDLTNIIASAIRIELNGNNLFLFTSGNKYVRAELA